MKHDILQIRKYMYQYVVRVQDIQEHFDASGVQTYIINSARVVFLKDREHSSPVKVCKPGICFLLLPGFGDC